MSVHKSQGSEYPVVVLPLLTQHYMMLQRNLLYTAITRAQKMVVIVGTRKAMAMAVKNNKIALEVCEAVANKIRKRKKSFHIPQHRRRLTLFDTGFWLQPCVLPRRNEPPDTWRSHVDPA